MYKYKTIVLKATNRIDATLEAKNLHNNGETPLQSDIVLYHENTTSTNKQYQHIFEEKEADLLQIVANHSKVDWYDDDD